MLEAVIATAVLGILASIVLPKLSYMLDVIYVDYEIRCMHSTMHYTKSASRLVNYNKFGLNPPSGYQGITLEMFIGKSGDLDCYCVQKYDSVNLLKSKRVLERSFTTNTNTINKGRICFNYDGDFVPAINGTMILSKGKVKRTLVLQGYGRARIDRK